MADKYTFKDVHRLYYWCNKVLPTVYDDSLSYYELLNKIALKLNTLIENYNELPEYIVQEIAEALQSEELGSILQAVISNFMLNVKYPPAGITPAVGDGATDDTEAIQGCIDWASENGGGAVYIPAGWYLTDSIEVKENVSLVGADRYATVFTLKGGATRPLVYGRGSNTIANLTLNANAGVQTQYQNALTLTGTDHLVKSCILDNGYYGLNIASSGHAQITDVVVPHCVYAGVLVDENVTAQVQMENVLVEEVGELLGDASFVINGNNGTYQIGSIATVDEALKITGDGNYVQLRAVNAVTDVTDTGTGNQILIETKGDSIVNRLVAQINSSITALTDDLATETTNRTTTDATLTTSIGKVAQDLSTEVTNRTDADTVLRGLINSLAESMDSVATYLAGKKIIVLGDSLAYGNTGGPTIAWPALLARDYGCTVVNASMNGSPISSYGDAPNSMVVRVQTVIANNPECDIFILEGGANDRTRDVPFGTISSSDSDTFYGAINNIISAVQTAYPGVQMMGMTEPMRTTNPNNSGYRSSEYVTAMLQAFRNHSLPCFDMYGGALGFNLFNSYFNWADYGYVHDGTVNHHWSEEAYEKMTPIIAKWIYNNGYNTPMDNMINWSGFNYIRFMNGLCIAFASRTFTDEQTSQFNGNVYYTNNLSVPIPSGAFGNRTPLYCLVTAYSPTRWCWAAQAGTATNSSVPCRVMTVDTAARTMSGRIDAIFIGAWK